MFQERTQLWRKVCEGDCEIVVRAVGRKPECMQDAPEGSEGHWKRRCNIFCASFIILIKSVFQSYLWVILLQEKVTLGHCAANTSASGIVLLHISMYLMCVFKIGLISFWQIPGCELAFCFCKSSFIGTQACPFIYVKVASILQQQKQSSVVATKTPQPTKHKIFTMCPFMFVDPWIMVWKLFCVN